MTGISLGGFKSLQIAALRPSALKAIVTACSTDDRYADDVHYMGGALTSAHLTRSCHVFGFNSRPPDPEVVGERWRDMWLEHLEHNAPWIMHWLEHQDRDAFWQHGSVCEDYSSIECAVCGVRDRRLGRRLQQRHTPSHGRAHLPPQGARRAVGSLLALRRPAGSEDRFPPARAALVG